MHELDNELISRVLIYEENKEVMCRVVNRKIYEGKAETDALIANYFLHTCTEFADVRNCHIYMDVVKCRLNSYFPNRKREISGKTNR